MKASLVTVYVVSHNYGKYLQEAIESVLRQTTDAWELLLINDDSDDNTKDIMELYRSDPKVSLLRTKGIGLTGAANVAMTHAKGKYIIRLDADDVFDDNILLILSNYLERHTDIAMVFPDYFLVDDYGGIISYEGRQSVYHKNHLLDMPANGACVMIRKNILKEVGGYREDLKAQDGLDLWTKILRQHKCANINLPLFYYRRHGENLTEDHVRILSARRAIKKDACAVNFNSYRPIIAVIPCRKHYDIYQDLWSKKLDDRTLLDIAIETCVKSSIIDQIIVTSDNVQAKEMMLQHSDKRLAFVERSKESTAYSCSIVHTLEHIDKTLGLDGKGVALLSYIQTPFTTTATLEEAVYTLILNSADSAFAVQEIEECVYRKSPHGLMSVNPQRGIRSDFDTLYTRLLTATATRNSNIRHGSLTGARIAHFVIPKEDAFFIHTKSDYKIARLLMQNQRDE